MHRNASVFGDNGIPMQKFDMSKPTEILKFVAEGSVSVVDPPSGMYAVEAKTF